MYMLIVFYYMFVTLPLSQPFAQFIKLTSYFLAFHLFFFSVEWTTRYLHVASAVRHGGSGAVCAASYLPIGPV